MTEKEKIHQELVELQKEEERLFAKIVEKRGDGSGESTYIARRLFEIQAKQDKVSEQYNRIADSGSVQTDE